MADWLNTWQDIAHVLGAELDYRNKRELDLRLEEVSMRVRHRQWVIVFEGISKAQGRQKTEIATQVQCFLQDTKNFHFNIYEQKLKDRLFKIIGLQDVPISDPELDKRYIIQTNLEDRIRELLQVPVVRLGFASPYVQQLRLLEEESNGSPNTSLKRMNLCSKIDKKNIQKSGIFAHFQLFVSALDGLEEINVI